MNTFIVKLIIISQDPLSKTISHFVHKVKKKKIIFISQLWFISLTSEDSQG